MERCEITESLVNLEISLKAMAEMHNKLVKRVEMLENKIIPLGKCEE